MSQNKWSSSPPGLDNSGDIHPKFEEMLRKGRPSLSPMRLSQNTMKKEATETSTTIKYISKALPIEVTPSEIIINDIEPNQTYEVIVLVRNLTNIGRRIRVYQPKTNKFRCDYDMQGNIAAGLAMKLIVSFETDRNGDFHDLLEIVSDDKFSVNVPLHAFQSQANIVFDPFINFGFIKVQKEEIRPVLFENQGKKDGKVDLKFDGSNELSVSPSSFVLKHGERREIMLKYTPKEAGIFRGTVEVSVEGQSILKNIDISATSVDYFIFTVDRNGAQTQTFDFGDIYFGQFKEIEGYLVNNSPQKFHYKAKFLTGMQSTTGDIFSIQTPFELGQEQIQRIMTCSPGEGVIDSYSQVPVKFSCKSRVTDDMIFWTRSYCMKKEKFDVDRDINEYTGGEQRFEPTNYSYTCIFEFDGKSDLSPYVSLSAKGICPTVKVSHHLINFGECKVHDRRDYLITLENKNEEHTVEFSFASIAHFQATPRKSKILPLASQQVIVTFQPKSLGKFMNHMELELFGIYKIPIKLMGSALSFSSPTKTLTSSSKGINSLPEDFSPQRKFVTDDQIDYVSKPTRKADKFLYSSMDASSKTNMLEQSNMSDKIELFHSAKQNKEKYNTFLKEQRQKRMDIPKEKERSQKFDLTIEKRNELLPNREFWLARDKDDEKEGLHPYDYDFIYGTQKIPMDQPRYALPDPREPLFVTKSLGQYEPHSTSSKVDIFQPDPSRPPKKLFPPEPSSQAEYRDTTKELSPEELQKVFVGPTTIDFGVVYVKSRLTKYFSVKNQLKGSILVQLSANNGELVESYQKPQIVPPMQTAAFEISFYSQNLQTFRGSVKYTINNKHEFAFAVAAQVEPVKLVLETNQIAFKFQEKDEDMDITNQVSIINKGTAPGAFKWDVTQNSVFKVNPMKGEVPAESTLKVAITYVPSGNNFKGEAERLGMQVENGEPQFINCIGYVNEARCEFKESVLDFGNVIVSQEQPKAVYLKNKQKTTATFKVSASLPAGVTVRPMLGRIAPDSVAEIVVTVLSHEEKVIHDDLVVSIRGGKQVRLPIKAKVIIPQVRIIENDFDFGGVTYGSTVTMSMTLVNESAISAVLNLDLTNHMDYPGIQYLQVIPSTEGENDDDSFIQSINQDNGPAEGFEEKEASLSMSDSEEEEEEKEQMRNFNIKIKENGTLKFLLKFRPEEAKLYNFELPIKLQGDIKVQGLSRVVNCRGLRPRCIIEPAMVEFKKKTITSFDKPAPDQEKIILSNMDLAKTIIWKFDTKDIDEERVFSVTPSQGKIEPGQQMTIVVGFSPLNPGQYESSIPLHLDNDMTKPYGHITLKGFGDFPKLLFDRREVILPTVPLDIESRCTFRIVNDGYENLSLRYEVANDLGGIGKEYLKLEFPEGKNLGVTKPKLKVEAIFKSSRPLSFTVELNFIDDSKRVYRIKISGTTDNCLFTNFPYLQRNVGDYEIQANDNEPIMIQELDNDDSETSPKAHSRGASKSGSVVSRAGRSLLGYSPIPQRELEKTCESVKNWLNQNVLTSFISKYPHDLIESNGSQIYELIQFLTGKQPPGRVNLSLITKKAEKVKTLHKQYDELIRVLKENGALLNTIRPEYLLKNNDYNAYLKMQDNQNVTANMSRLSEGKFLYLSIDAWTTLFYQILKIYFLGKVSLKTFRNTPGMPPEKLNVPDYYIEGSNIISLGENLLLRWMEVHYEKHKPGLTKRIKNFGDDLKDGHVFSAVIQSYVGSHATKSLGYIRNNPQNKDDYIYNAGKIMGALEELGLQTPLSAKDLESPSQRDMILFCLYLYNNLPHYIPKATIEFTCMLRETVVKCVELSNPANKSISYRVRLEGDPDFSLEEGEERDSNIHLEPRSSIKFPVKYTARLSKPMSGRLLFTNRKEEGNIQAAALIFELKSKVIGRHSETTETLQTRLYELKSKDIRVENIFNLKADFQIELIYQRNPPQESDKRRKNDKHRQRPIIKTEAKPDDHFQPFSTKLTTLTIPRQGAASIPIQFLPFNMETHTCYLVFRDDKVGEMQYTLIGEVELPPPIELPNSGNFFLENEIRLNLQLNYQNHLIQAARKTHIERLPQAQRPKEHEKEKVIRAAEKAVEFVSFDCESLSQFLSLPPTFTLINTHGKNLKPEPEKKGGSPKKRTDASPDAKSDAANAVSENKISALMSFKAPTKDHPIRFVMRSQNKMDIRVYEVKVSVLPKPVKATLEMRCAAGDTLSQDIPIKNDSDKDWNIKANLIVDGGRNAHCFSGGKDFRVPRHQTASYSIVFKPPWIMTAEVKLVLSNAFNNQQYEFEIRGVGEEPLAEGHIIMDCKARKTKAQIFRIKNDTDKKLAYRVETDLYNASGKSNFELHSGKMEDYVLEVTPMIGGAYTGSITFFDDLGRYKWWTVEVHTESPKAEKTIDLVTTIRKAIAFDLTISNPLDETVVFEVMMYGDGLFGDNAFTLPPKQTGVYELVYSPLKAMKQTGSLAFTHEKLGELWYELNLQADEPQAIRLATLKAELGKTESHEVELENPTNKEVKVYYKLSNPHNFDIVPEDIYIQPYDSTIVQIRYMPSDLDVMETSEVTFETEEIGKWAFLAFGQGIPPTKFNLQTISGSLNRDSSSIINFKNPFKDAIAVSFSLEADEESKKVFEILLKKTKMNIIGLSTIQIPISFLPRAISDYYAELVIAMNEKISWRYPLKGVTESYSSSSDFFLKTKCRVRYETELKINLPGNPNVEPDEHYVLELVNVPKEYERILQNQNHKALVFTPVKDTIRAPGEPLCYKTVFQPLKPFKGVVDIAIVKSSGGRWKFKLYLEATMPDADDTITITSPINKTSSISFKLTNYTKYAAEFTSNFTAESDSEFTVNPRNGILEPYGKEREGTNFIISFTPVEYGKMKSGRLIIQTEEMLWSYNIKGVFPKYIVPKISGTRIENRLSDEMVKKLSPKKMNRNFLVENIKSSSHSPNPKRPRDRSRSRSRSRSPQKDNKDVISLMPSAK